MNKSVGSRRAVDKAPFVRELSTRLFFFGLLRSAFLRDKRCAHRSPMCFLFANLAADAQRRACNFNRVHFSVWTTWIRWT
jgi:hypothetical protein